MEIHSRLWNHFTCARNMTLHVRSFQGSTDWPKFKYVCKETRKKGLNVTYFVASPSLARLPVTFSVLSPQIVISCFYKSTIIAAYLTTYLKNFCLPFEPVHIVYDLSKLVVDLHSTYFSDSWSFLTATDIWSENCLTYTRKILCYTPQYLVFIQPFNRN